MCQCSQPFQNFSVTDLLCEYARDPIGIDSVKPRLSWSFEHHARGQRQSAYRIIASGSMKNLELGIGDLWDTGKVMSDQSLNVEYAGKALTSGKSCFWKVKVWDLEGKASDFSEPASFEMGLLHPGDWQGAWMGFSAGRNGGALYYRKEFELCKKVAKARAYISGLGYYELRLNGSKVGDHVLDPGFTDYSKRVLYVTYTVEGYLREGKNVAGIVAGNGWYGTPKVMLQMNIEFDDGSTESIISDPNTGWLVSGGPIVNCSIYDGEIYDARLEKEGWDTPAYLPDKDAKCSNGWIRAMVLCKPGGLLHSQTMEPIKVMKDIVPVHVGNPFPGIYVYDMGQNMAGWARLKVKGPAGTEVVLKFGENLYANGLVNQENLRTALCRDIYILKGGREETYEPCFTYHGFRYVQMEGYPGVPDSGSLTGRVVYSSVEQTGNFGCSNELVNRIHQNVLWTESGNLHSIPTDCPQRDERIGWLNDATVRCEEAIYNFNMARFYPKWMNDIREAQDEETGALSDTAPFVWGRRPADPVSSCQIIIPYLLYLHYGDRRAMEQNYDSMKEWVRYLGSRAEGHMVGYSYYGDWAPPAAETVGGSEGSAVSAKTPGEFMSTAYYCYNCILLSRIADVLGRKDEAEEFRALSDKIAEALNNRYLNAETGQYAMGSQAANVFPLYLRIVPEQSKKMVLNNLVKDIVDKQDYHLTTGNQCTKYVPEVLANEGYADTAYKIVTRESYPSWGYMVSCGATTIWERWEYATGNTMNSHNHPMMATIGSWFYKVLAGISPDPGGPGYGQIIIKPYFVKGLDHVNASVKTVRGPVVSRWEINKDSVRMHISIPGNCEARIFIPTEIHGRKVFEIEESCGKIWSGGSYCSGVRGFTDGRREDDWMVFRIGSGNYTFRISLKQYIDTAVLLKSG